MLRHRGAIARLAVFPHALPVPGLWAGAVGLDSEGLQRTRAVEDARRLWCHLLLPRRWARGFPRTA